MERFVKRQIWAKGGMVLHRWDMSTMGQPRDGQGSGLVLENFYNGGQSHFSVNGQKMFW